jgi:hypothetical protein
MNAPRASARVQSNAAALLKRRGSINSLFDLQSTTRAVVAR